MMKTYFLLGMIISLSAFGYDYRRKHMSLKLQSTISEADVVSQAEALIPSIISFKHKMIRKEAAYNNCSRMKRDIKLGQLTVKKVYISSDNISFEPVYFGRLGYILKKCRRD